MPGRSLPTLALVLLGAGCGGSSPPAQGGPGQPCRSDKSCDAGLVCLLELCVRSFEAGPPPPDALVDHRALPDAPRLDRSLASDGPRSDLAKPKADLSKPTPDLPKPKADQGPPPSCTTWSAWSCIAWPKAGLACWSTCGAGPALWCTSTGSCTCTSSATPCASGLAVNLGNPCATCEAAFVSKGCCHP